MYFNKNMANFKAFLRGQNSVKTSYFRGESMYSHARTVTCLSNSLLKIIQFQSRHEILTSNSWLLMVFAMKMRLNCTYGLPNLCDFKINHLHLTSRMVIQQFKVWRENIIIFNRKIKISCWFWNWIVFRPSILIGDS